MTKANIFNLNLYRVKQQNSALVKSLTNIWGSYLPQGELLSILNHYYLPSDDCAGYGLAGLALPTIETSERDPGAYHIHFHDCSKFHSFEQSNAAFTQMKTEVTLDSPFIQRSPVLGTISRKSPPSIPHYTLVKSEEALIHLFIGDVVTWHQQHKINRVIHPFLGFRNLLESLLSEIPENAVCSFLPSSPSCWSYAVQISDDDCFVFTLYPETIQQMNTFIQHLAQPTP